MALDRIHLVSGDNLPQIAFQLTNSDTGQPADLSDLTSVILKFRPAGSEVVLSEIYGAWQAAQGLIAFEFPTGVLEVAEGDYEGEIEFHFGAKVQTAYELLKFFVRQDF